MKPDDGQILIILLALLAVFLGFKFLRYVWKRGAGYNVRNGRNHPMRQQTKSPV